MKNLETQRKRKRTAVPPAIRQPKKEAVAIRVGETHAARAGDGRTEVRPEERQRMIELAAYYRAERRGFSAGSAEQDWLEAEAEIDRALGGATG